MKTLHPLVSLLTALTLGASAQEAPTSTLTTPPPAANSSSWSMIYLPDLDWNEEEIIQIIDLLNELKPNLVVSYSPCSFADKIRSLENKPKVLDKTQRTKDGEKCGVPINPLAAYVDTSTLQIIGKKENQSPHLVWISSTESKHLYHGPRNDEDERDSLAKFQVREQMIKRRGEVVFLIDPELNLSHEQDWLLPRNNVHYEQAPSAVTGLACIRPATLQHEIPAINGIAARIPVLHWIHSGSTGMEWNILPIDKGPAIQHTTYRHTQERESKIAPRVKWLMAPVAGSQVPLWMDHYLNDNPALEAGNTIQRGGMTRLFGWEEYDFQKAPFKLLDAVHHPVPDPKLQLPELPRGAVRSPNNLFSITVGQLGAQGWYPEDSDDGINIYLDDRRTNKSHHLYVSGLYGPWPTAATWFTDRYVITSGVAAPIDDWNDSNAYSTSTKPPTSLYVFDLQAGKSFTTVSYATPKTLRVGPTERIYFPNEPSYVAQNRWKFLWRKVEAGYHIKPQEAPVSIETATTTAKQLATPNLKWKDLGIWPSPETWQLVSEKEKEHSIYPEKKIQNGGHPFLTFTETTPGQRQYRLAISSIDQFHDEHALDEIVAHADLFTTGEEHMRQLNTVERVGENKQCLLLSGTFTKPNSEKGYWMRLLDLSSHRAWSAHW